MGEVQEIFISFEQTFRAMRVLNNQIQSPSWSLKAEVYIPEDYDENNFNMAVTKIKFWIEHVLSDSIIFCKDNTWARNAFIDDSGPSVENQIVITPFEPVDYHLVSVIKEKMNAIAEGNLYIGSMELKSDINKGVSYTLFDDGESDSPLPTMEEWVGSRAYYQQPWWGRADSSTFDIVPEENADLLTPPQISFTFDFLEDMASYSKEPAKILRPAFKPEIIEGFKKDDEIKE